MAIQHAPIPLHWNYFFSLEDDVLSLSRWIELCADNESVYSIELARLLMTASAEADVVAKALCKSVSPDSRASSINAYQKVLLPIFPHLPQAAVSIPRFGQRMSPWENWASADTPPDWWTANNKVKHHRASNFSDANLKNVLNSISGLFILLILLDAQSNLSLIPGPRVFEPLSYAYRDYEAIAYHSDARAPINRR
jgi:hypothetical protein